MKKIIVFISFFCLLSCDGTKQEKYLSITECEVREMQKCSAGDSACSARSIRLCKELLPSMFSQAFIDQQTEILVQEKKESAERIAMKEREEKERCDKYNQIRPDLEKAIAAKKRRIKHQQDYEDGKHNDPYKYLVDLKMADACDDYLEIDINQ